MKELENLTKCMADVMTWFGSFNGNFINFSEELSKMSSNFMTCNESTFGTSASSTKNITKSNIVGLIGTVLYIHGNRVLISFGVNYPHMAMITMGHLSNFKIPIMSEVTIKRKSIFKKKKRHGKRKRKANAYFIVDAASKKRMYGAIYKTYKEIALDEGELLLLDMGINPYEDGYDDKDLIQIKIDNTSTV